MAEKRREEKKMENEKGRDQPPTPSQKARAVEMREMAEGSFPPTPSVHLRDEEYSTYTREIKLRKKRRKKISALHYISRLKNCLFFSLFLFPSFSPEPFSSMKYRHTCTCKV